MLSLERSYLHVTRKNALAITLNQLDFQQESVSLKIRHRKGGGEGKRDILVPLPGFSNSTEHIRWNTHITVGDTSVYLLLVSTKICKAPFAFGRVPGIYQNRMGVVQNPQQNTILTAVLCSHLFQKAS